MFVADRISNSRFKVPSVMLHFLDFWKVESTSRNVGIVSIIRVCDRCSDRILVGLEVAWSGVRGRYLLQKQTKIDIFLALSR